MCLSRFQRRLPVGSFIFINGPECFGIAPVPYNFMGEGCQRKADVACYMPKEMLEIFEDVQIAESHNTLFLLL